MAAPSVLELFIVLLVVILGRVFLFSGLFIHLFAPVSTVRAVSHVLYLTATHIQPSAANAPQRLIHTHTNRPVDLPTTHPIPSLFSYITSCVIIFYFTSIVYGIVVHRTAVDAMLPHVGGTAQPTAADARDNRPTPPPPLGATSGRPTPPARHPTAGRQSDMTERDTTPAAAAAAAAPTPAAPIVAPTPAAARVPQTDTPPPSAPTAAPWVPATAQTDTPRDTKQQRRARGHTCPWRPARGSRLATRRIPQARAESQQIAAWQLLYRVQHPARYLSRLQTIPSPDIEI